MTRIAHLSDLHMLERDHHRRDGVGRLRLELLSFGRSIDADDRRARLRRALDAVRRSAADHLVVTGDLTEDGCDAQFEVLAEVLLDAGLRPDAVTLVPGNHDAYTDGMAFTRALAGALRPFAPTSRPGAVTDVGEVRVVPVSTAMPQPITRSAGVIAGEALDALDALGDEHAARDGVLVVAQHHPPHPHRIPGMTWLDGLQNHARARHVLGRRRAMHVLCGHTHRASNRSLGAEPEPRVFCATAVVDSAAPLRLYDVRHGQLVPVEPGAGVGSSAVEGSRAPTYAPRATAVAFG